MSVSIILGAIRKKKTVAKQTTFGAYMDLVRAVASGQETDADKAADVIELAGKKDEDFERDVETQQNRCEWYRQMESLAVTQDAIARLSAEQDQLQEKLNAAIAKYQPGINDAFNRIRLLEQEVMSVSSAESRLLESCIDKTLLDRESELLAKRGELLQQRRPLDEDFDRSRNMRSTYETALRNEIAAESKEDYAPSKVNRREQIAKWRHRLTSNESFRDQLAAAIRGIDAELEPIQKELDEIRKAKLLP